MPIEQKTVIQEGDPALERLDDVSSVGEPSEVVAAEVATVTKQADELLAQVERDRAAGIVVDTDNTVAQLEAVKRDAQKLTAVFTAQLRRILDKVGAVIKGIQDQRLEKALLIPDNPKVIKRLLKDLASPDCSLEDTIAIYEAAAKYHTNVWHDVVKAMDDKIAQTIPNYLKKGDSAGALQLYDKASSNARYEPVRTVLLAGLVAPLLAVESPTESFNGAGFLSRRQLFAKTDAIISSAARDRHELSSLYYSEKPKLEQRLFSQSERFLLTQPVAAVDALVHCPSDQQPLIVEAWSSHPTMKWDSLLVDERSADLIPIVLAYPEVTTYWPSADRDAVLHIADGFTPAERSQAWDKAGHPTCSSWDDVHAYLVVGRLPQSTSEQIKMLSDHWSYVTLALLSYGESKVAELWTEDNIGDLQDYANRRAVGYGYSRVAPAQLFGFARELSPILRQHLPTRNSGGGVYPSPTRPDRMVRDYTGFQALPDQLAGFQQALQRVPTEQRDALFSVLRPDEGYYGAERWQYLTSEQAQHCIEYVGETASAQTIRLETLINIRDYFTGSRWEDVQRGIMACRTAAVVVPQPRELRAALDLYEQAGRPEQATTNQFISQCQLRSNAFPLRSSRHSEDCYAEVRSVDTIRQLQAFSEFCQTYFAAERTLTADFLELNNSERQLITDWLDGTTIATAATAFDLPVIEGMMVELSKKLNSLDDANRTKLDRFRQLQPEQQARWLFLRRAMRDTEANHVATFFELAQSSTGEQVEQFVRDTGLSNFFADATIAMAERADCVGLFRYLDSDKLYREHQKPVVDKLIELHDAGLPQQFHRTSSVDKKYFTSSDNGYAGSVEKLMAWEVPALVQIARFAAEVHPDLPLTSLVNLNPTSSLEGLQRSVEYAAAQNSDYVSSYGTAQPEEIAKIQQRRSQAEQLTGLVCNANQIARLSYLTESAWMRLVQIPAALQLYVESNSTFPDAAVTLPDSLLTDPRVWQHTLPDTVWADSEKIQAVLAIQDSFAAAKIEPNSYYNFPWEHLAQAWQKAPWLFSVHSLELFRGHDVAQLAAFTDLSAEAWERVLPIFVQYSFSYASEVSEFIEAWSTQALPLSEPQMQIVQGYVHKLPWSDLKVIGQRLQQGESMEQIAAANDAAEDTYPHHWAKARREFFQRALQTDLPTFGTGQELPVVVWQQLSQLPSHQLQQLEGLARHAGILRYYPNEVEKFLMVAQHPNAAVVVDLLATYPFSFRGTAKHDLGRLCDRLTTAVVDQIRNWPDKPKLQVTDAPDFFADPQAGHVAAFAQELSKMFGDDISFTVYDLLIMDIDQDLANLKELQRTCSQPVTPEHLRRLAPVTSGDMHQTITKLLAMFDGSYKIDFHDSIEQLSELNPGLRVAVILGKGPGNFGWSVLPYRQELVSSLAMTSAEVDELVFACYQIDNEHMPTLDVPSARALLALAPDHADSIDQSKLLRAVFAHYKADPAEIIDLVYAQSTTLLAVAHAHWDRLPPYVSQDRRFWQLILEQKPLLFLDHYAEHVADVALPPDKFDVIISTANSTQLDTFADIALAGDIILSKDQQVATVVRYIEQGNDLSGWASQPAKLTWLQDVFVSVARAWKESEVDQQAILAQLTAAGLVPHHAGTEVLTVTPFVEDRLLAVMVNRMAGGVQGLGSDIDLMLGERVNYLRQQAEVRGNQLVRAIVASEFNKLAASTGTGSLSVTVDNWLGAVTAFVRTTIDDHQLPPLPSGMTEQATAAFKSTEAKDLCLQQLQKLWQTYLQARDINRPPLQLMTVTGFVNDCEGAGPLGQFEALSLFIHQFQTALTKTGVSHETRHDVMNGAAAMEARFSRERWSNEDRADFYNISKDVMQADPNLFGDFLRVFQQFSPSELKRFHEEIYPLYRAQLAVLSKQAGPNGAGKYAEADLAAVRASLAEFVRARAAGGTKTPFVFDAARHNLIVDLTDRFKTRFGITKIPEQFTAEHVRSLTNTTMYLANIRSRDQSKEHILGWYLALLVNNKWEAYRRGEALAPADYLGAAQAATIEDMLEKRRLLSPITAERLHVQPDDLPAIQALLQTESPVIALGDVETIDVKLGNVVANLHTLEDLDLYPDPLDKQRMQILLTYGNKAVGATATKLFQSLSRPDRAVAFTDDELAIRQQLELVLENRGLAVTAENVKLHWQEGVKALAIVANVARLVEDNNAVAEISRLQDLLLPSAEVIAIFSRLGEEFKAHSGAKALTQDLDYLDNIIVKRSDELSGEEVALLTTYVAGIRAQVVKLQSIYDQIKTKFGSTKSTQATTANTLLREKLGQIDQIINTQSAQQTVTSTMTHQFNAVVENIRECLSCTKQGCNNDTDLTFGDSNKFFIYSNTESQRKGSIADQIVFLEPIIRPDGGQELSFVLDRVYGTCTPFILTNHIETVVKKCRTLKQRFPEATVSVCVSQAAMATGGVSAEQLGIRLREHLGSNLTIEPAQVEVDVVGSAAADHYVEFGGDTRTAGRRKIDALLLHVN